MPIVGNFDPPIQADAAPSATGLGTLTSTLTANQDVEGTQWFSLRRRTGNVSLAASSVGEHGSDSSMTPT